MNKKHLIEACLNSLYKNTKYKNYKVIVLDNGSTDGTIEFVKKNYKKADLIENGENLGFARANNVGIKYALKKYDPDYYFLLNDDTEIIQHDWLEKMIGASKTIKNSGVIGCQLIYPDGSLQIYSVDGKQFMAPKEKKLKLSGDQKKIQEVRWTIGAAFMIDKEVIGKIGLLDPGYFPIYGEEIDYCERARKNGFKVIYTPFARMIHIGSATTNDKRKGRWKWKLQKKMSIRLELIQFPVKEILHWQLVHLGSVFFRKEGTQTKFNKDFLIKGFLLLGAYFENIRQISEIIRLRRSPQKKIWY